VAESLIYAVIGPNGAGKTTLFNVLCGFYQPSAGSMRFAARNCVGLPPHRIAACGIARTFQNLQLFFNMTVLENVMVGWPSARQNRSVGRCSALAPSTA
jgi:branched-chain amino acid transport system ATP-binding protein